LYFLVFQNGTVGLFRIRLIALFRFDVERAFWIHRVTEHRAKHVFDEAFLVLLFLGNFDVLDFLGRVNALVFAVGRIDEVFIDEA